MNVPPIPSIAMLFVALLLALIELIRSHGGSLIAWAVLLIAIVLTFF